MNLAWAMVAAIGLGLGLWSLVSLAPKLNRPRLSRRIAPYLLDVSAGARESLAPAPPGPLPVLGILVEPISSRAERALGALLGGPDVARRRLRQSGSNLSVESFRSQQLLWGAIGAGVGATAVIAAQSLALLLAAFIVGAVIGLVARDWVLQRAARRRLARLEAELPVILEFLTLSLSAGEGILDAIRRVAGVSASELSRELGSVVASVNTGLPFGETLTKLANELELPAFSRCVEQVVGALERGTPLAEVLRAQAQDARDDAKRRLLEVAGRREVAMLFPLVFLILPVTICFAIFPGLIVLQLGL